MPATPWRTKARPAPDRQYLVLATQLPLRSYRTLPQFMALTLAVVRQLELTTGLIGYTLDAHPLAKTFRTLSAWESAAALDAFARALPHTSVMRKLRSRMNPTTFVTWEVAGTNLPITWEEARTRIHTAATTSTTPQTRQPS